MEGQQFGNITKQKDRQRSQLNNHHYDSKTAKTPSPTNVIVNLNSEFRRCKITPSPLEGKEIVENDNTIVTAKIRNCSDENSQRLDHFLSVSTSPEQSKIDNIIPRNETLRNVENDHCDDILFKNTNTPIFEKENAKQLSSTIDYIKSSPGTQFVSDLSEYIELDHGQYGVLAGIMDRQWDKIVMETINDDSTANIVESDKSS